jgi:putative transposase
MCSLFRNKYRNESIRLNNHDYSSDGEYFITICTHRMIPYFGNISCEKMIMSESGRIAYKLWYELPEHFSFISLDEFVIMPNHIHAIIIIKSQTPVGTLHANEALHPPVGTLHATSLQSPQQLVRTLHATAIQYKQNEFMATISPKRGSLATVIRSYKSAVSKNVHLIDTDFSWHPRYYDHIIRSDRELFRIRKYIINNPVKWDNQ